MSVLAIAAASTIWISAPADPACALAEDVSRALGDLIPEATVRPGEVAAAEDLIVRVAAGAGDELVVEVVDGRGGVLLARTVPRRGSCGETAEAIALIVERYVTDLGWRPATVGIPAPVGKPQPPPPPGPRIGGELAVRGALAFGPAQLGGALEVALDRRRVRVALEVGGLAPRARDVTGDGGAALGELALASLHALAGAGAGLGRLRVMGRVGGEWLHASAAGDGVFQRVDRGAWQVLVRADAAYRFAVTRAVSVAPWAAVELRPRPVAITVEGTSDTYSYPRLRLAIGAGALWRFR